MPPTASDAATATVEMSTCKHGHKFHIRALALVVGIMDVYLFDECRVLIAPVPMTLPMDIDITNDTFDNERPAAGSSTAAPAPADNKTSLTDTDEQAESPDLPETAGPKGPVSSLSSSPASGQHPDAQSSSHDLHAHITNRSFNKTHRVYEANRSAPRPMQF